MLPEMIAACSRNFPSKTAFIQGRRSATWSEMDRRSTRFACVLRALGAERGDTVAILAQERIEVYEHWFASIKAGTVRVGINWRYSAREMLHIITDCRPKVLVVDSHCVASLPGIAARLDEIGCHIVGFGEEHGIALDYETLLAEAGDGLEPVAYSGTEPVLCTYTSGTTGSPKGVLLNERAVATAMKETMLAIGVSPDDVWYRPNQSSWVVLIGNSSGLANGMTMVIPDGQFQIQSFLSDIERLRVTVVLVVPTVLVRLLDEYATRHYDLSSLNRLVYGGGPITPQLIRRTLATFDCKLVQIYGMTEVTWVATLQHGDHIRGLQDKPALLTSAGRIAPHFEASVRDDDGNPVALGEIGTVWLRGPCLMNGYHKQPELTGRVLMDGGWFVTHDMGYLDEEGYLYLRDRKSFLIISGGANIYPTSVEEVIARHPGVKEVAVVGAPDPVWGEIVVAFLVAHDPAARIDLDDVAQFCRGQLSSMEVPKRVVVVNELPRNFTGKIDKLSLKRSLTS